MTPSSSWLLQLRRRDYTFVTLVLLLVALALRLFHADAVLGIRWDEAKYLGLAKNFPYHRLFNDELYLIHGPGYPALIRLGMIFLPDHAAAIAVSIVMSAVTFWAIAGVGNVLRPGRTGVLLARMFLVFLPMVLLIPQQISKEAVMVALYALLLGGLVRYVAGNGRAGWLAAVAGGVFALTADQHVPLMLISLVLVRLTWPQRRARLGLLPLMPLLVIWIGIVIVRLVRFTMGPLVPIGIDGLPERAADLGLVQAIIPNTSIQSKALSNFTDLSTNIENSATFVQDFFLLNSLPYGAHLWHAILLFLVVLGAFRVLFFERGRRRWLGIGMLLSAAVLFGVPMWTKPQARYAMMAVVPMASLVAMNSRWFGGRWMEGRRAWWGIALCTVLAAAAVFVARGNRHCVLDRPLLVEAEVVARLIEELPTRGIMAQVGYSPELAYLTDRRILGLPNDPGVLDEAVLHFDISHIVVGSQFGRPWDWHDRKVIINGATIDHVLSRQDAYKKVATVWQEAVPGRNGDRFLILEVDQERLRTTSKATPDRGDDQP